MDYIYLYGLYNILTYIWNIYKYIWNTPVRLLESPHWTIGVGCLWILHHGSDLQDAKYKPAMTGDELRDLGSPGLLMYMYVCM